MRRASSRASAKISPVFSARLNQMAPRQKVRAVVLLGEGDVTGELARRPSRQERRAMARALREAAARAMDDLGGVLERHGGIWLSDQPDALGSVPVETTAAGIRALARSRHVRAVMEDQDVRPV